MIAEKESPRSQPASSANPFDDWRVVALALLMSIGGYSVLVGLPVMAAAWVEGLGYTDAQVGRLSSVDLGGVAIGALITAALVARVNRRLIALTAAAVTISSNFLCLSLTTFEHTFLLRIIAGVGSGAYLSVAIATLGANSKPERVFTLMLFTFVFTQALQLELFTRLDISGIYWALIAIYAAAIPFCLLLPATPVTTEVSVEEDVQKGRATRQHISVKLPIYIPLACLLAILATYVSTGTYWTYIGLAGEDAGVPSGIVDRGLVWGSLTGIFSCIVAAFLNNRFGVSRPLMLIMALMLLPVAILMNGISTKTILVSLLSFNSLWILADIYQMSAVSRLDHSGRFPSLVMVSQGSGQIVGPALSAGFLDAGLGYDAVFALCIVATLTAMLIYGWIFLKVGRLDPMLRQIL